MSPAARVLRDGLFKVIPADTVVRGDIIEIIAGERVPADVLIIQSVDLVIDNHSIIKGNTYKEISPECQDRRDILLSENIAFSQAFCKERRGLGTVIQTGKRRVYAMNYKRLLKSQKKK